MAFENRVASSSSLAQELMQMQNEVRILERQSTPGTHIDIQQICKRLNALSDQVRASKDPEIQSDYRMLKQRCKILELCKETAPASAAKSKEVFTVLFNPTTFVTTLGPCCEIDDLCCLKGVSKDADKAVTEYNRRHPYTYIRSLRASTLYSMTVQGRLSPEALPYLKKRFRAEYPHLPERAAEHFRRYAQAYESWVHFSADEFLQNGSSYDRIITLETCFEECWKEIMDEAIKQKASFSQLVRLIRKDPIQDIRREFPETWFPQLESLTLADAGLSEADCDYLLTNLQKLHTLAFHGISDCSDPKKSRKFKLANLRLGCVNKAAYGFLEKFPHLRSFEIEECNLFTHDATYRYPLYADFPSRLLKSCPKLQSFCIGSPLYQESAQPRVWQSIQGLGSLKISMLARLLYWDKLTITDFQKKFGHRLLFELRFIMFPHQPHVHPAYAIQMGIGKYDKWKRVEGFHSPEETRLLSQQSPPQRRISEKADSKSNANE